MIDAGDPLSAAASQTADGAEHASGRPRGDGAVRPADQADRFAEAGGPAEARRSGETTRAELAARLSRLPPSHPSAPGYPDQPEPPGGENAPARDELRRTARNGWDDTGVASHPDRPAPESLRLTPARLSHILDGDSTGGGHRHGTGHPGKTEFPADWDDSKIAQSILDVARFPRSVHLQWNGRWKGGGERDGVEISAVVDPDGVVWTAWPEPGGPGVTRNA